MKITYTNLEGEIIDFSSRAELSRCFGGWMCTDEDKVTASSIVSWCDARIAKYEQWIRECKNFKKVYQQKLITDVDPEILLGSVPTEQIAAYLAKRKG